jgi:hypothetical protein
VSTVTDKMVDLALNAWFANPPSETDQGLERSMRAALEAGLGSRSQPATSSESDSAISRRQFPDGSVPGNDREAAEGWCRWYKRAETDGYNKGVRDMAQGCPVCREVALPQDHSQTEKADEPCPYAFDHCLLEKEEIGPCLCANPVGRILPACARNCQKCGTPTNGEETLIRGQIWCHPCADTYSSEAQRKLKLLADALVTLRHARIFITTREKMHPTGIELYDELIKNLERELG